MVAIMAMLHGERWLFFGDDCQLPPVMLVDDGRPARERSIFGLLKNRGFDTMLEETWRLNAELSEWPSATFYRNRLVCRHDRRLELSPAPTHPALTTPASTVLVVCGGNESTVRSDKEAQTAADVVRSLVSGGIAPADIGVVTPFRSQASRVRQILSIPVAGTGLNFQVVVDTVERFQGQEREVIVITLASSKSEWVRRMAAFLFQRERWNVAVTRARRKIVVVTSAGLLECLETLADEGDEGAVCFSSWRKSISLDAIVRL
jgi:DNA replication ATP-dependent helicase Dna2